MKLKKHFIWLISVYLFSVGLLASSVVAGSQSDASGIKMAIEPSNNAVNFELAAEGLSDPLRIGRRSMIYFETVQCRTWIKGEPYASSSTKDHFSGQWIFDQGKIISIEIAKHGSDFIVSFSSQGGPEILKWGLGIEAEDYEYFAGLTERTDARRGRDEASWREGVTAGMNIRGQEICKAVRGDDFFLFPRAAYTGSSRYSGFWGGDTAGTSEGLRSAIISLLRCSVSGYPLWGSDTGGYRKGGQDRVLCARWLAFSCFCPFMEVGPTGNRGLWDRKDQPHYDAELLAVWRLYAKLHANIVDYT
jgi:hypothetical protein